MTTEKTIINNLEEFSIPKKAIYFTPYKSLLISMIFFISILFVKKIMIIGLVFILLITLIAWFLRNKKHVLFFDTYMIIYTYDNKMIYRISYSDIKKIEIKNSEIIADLFRIWLDDDRCIDFDTFKSKKIKKEINHFRKILGESVL